MKNKIIWYIIFVILVIAIILASRFVNNQGEQTIQESNENTNILNDIVKSYMKNNEKEH